MKATARTVDPEEIERFSRLSDTWWDENGPMKPLHRMNALRVGWIVKQLSDTRQQAPEAMLTPDNRQLTSLKGVRLLDIGCGGGLVCEPLARLGAEVTGIDASEKNIAVAKLHAAQSGLKIEYQCTTAEELSAEKSNNSQLSTQHSALYDAVIALEIIEHVADIPAFVEAACKLAKPGGLVIFSTINRTAKAFALAIVGAEYVLRLLPRGTHTWGKFVRPSELAHHLRANKVEVTEMTGMVMNPLTMQWELNARDMAVNYLLAGRIT